MTEFTFLLTLFVSLAMSISYYRNKMKDKKEHINNMTDEELQELIKQKRKERRQAYEIRRIRRDNQR